MSVYIYYTNRNQVLPRKVIYWSRVHKIPNWNVIEENAKPSTLGNTPSNAVLERINQVLGNLVQNFNISTQTYIDKNDPWAGILATAEFSIYSTNNREKGYILVQLIFGRDNILLVKHRADWELIRQQRQTKNNRDNTQENKHRF